MAAHSAIDAAGYMAGCTRPTLCCAEAERAGRRTTRRDGNRRNSAIRTAGEAHNATRDRLGGLDAGCTRPTLAARAQVFAQIKNFGTPDSPLKYEGF